MPGKKLNTGSLEHDIVLFSLRICIYVCVWARVHNERREEEYSILIVWPNALRKVMM